MCIRDRDNGAVEELSLTEMQMDYPDLYEIVKEYTSTMTSEPEEVNTDHTKLTKTYTLTNKLSGAKEAVWHKQWQDGYNLDKNLRPDIYLEIYRKSKDEVTRLDTVSYRWEYLDEDIASGNEGGEKLERQWHWHAVAEGLPKYDNDGYEITYYAAVSYTHPDVYKRQLRGRMTGLSRCQPARMSLTMPDLWCTRQCRAKKQRNIELYLRENL